MHFYKSILIIVCVLLCVFESSGRCRFPRSWRGLWWQSGGLGSVLIKNTSIQNKGRCVTHIQDYYVLENTENNCYQCLLIMNPHENILQYKESFCETNVSPNIVCSRISVENMLFIMVKENPVLTSLQCPFSPNSYRFTYSDDFYGFCENANSSLSQCMDHMTYHVTFRHCEQEAFMHNKDLQLSCLGHWKEGSDYFMYGKLSANNVNQYRCFMYERLGSMIQMSMSNDGTCRGMTSAADGPIRISLTQDVAITSTCTFPSWLLNRSWRTLAGHHIYKTSKKHPSDLEVLSQSILHTTIQCLREVNKTTNSIIIQIQSIHQCTKTYQCMYIDKTHPDVIHIFTKEIKDFNVRACPTTHEDYDKGHTLIPHSASTEPSSCLLQGHYSLLQKYNTDACYGFLEFGCADKESNMKIKCNEESVMLQCVTSWTESGKIYLIAINLKHPNQHGHCFKISYGQDEGYLSKCHDSRLVPLKDKTDITKFDYTFSWTAQKCQSGSSSLEEAETMPRQLKTTPKTTTETQFILIDNINISYKDYKFLNKSLLNTNKQNSVTHKYVSRISSQSGPSNHSNNIYRHLGLSLLIYCCIYYKSRYCLH